MYVCVNDNDKIIIFIILSKVVVVVVVVVVVWLTVTAADTNLKKQIGAIRERSVASFFSDYITFSPYGPFVECLAIY